MTNLPSLRSRKSRAIIAAKKEAVGLQQLLEGEYLDFMRKQIRSCDGGFA